MKLVYCLNLFLCFAIYTHGQTPRASGLLLDNMVYDSLPRLMRLNGAKFDEIPLQTSLKDFCPKAEDQGEIGSCVGWATGYGALTMLRAIKGKVREQEQINKMAHSASFIFNQIKEDDCDLGAFLNDALYFLKQKGDCLVSSFPNSKTNCDKQPSKAQLEQASFYKIKEYAKVFEREDVESVKLSQVKKLLSDSIPVIIGIELDENFCSLNGTTRQWTPAINPKFLFVHAMVIVGYNDVTETFELFNSYGEDWGNAGFFELSYTDFVRYCQHAYMMVFDPSNLPPLVELKSNDLAIEGKFLFRQLVGEKVDSTGISSPVFENQDLHLVQSKGIYQLNKNPKIGDVFQLIVQDIPSEQHVYILSLDHKNKVELHWPKNNLATFVPSKKTSIILPHKNRGLQLSHKGTDHLIILYSDKKLENIQSQIQQLKTVPGEIKEKLDIIFDDLLVPDEYIYYYPDKMQFESHHKKENGTTVALVLSVLVD